MKAPSLFLTGFLVWTIAADAMAQITPFCPTNNPRILLGPLSGSSVITPNTQIGMSIRQNIPVNNHVQAWDFPIQDVTVDGMVVTGIALGVYAGEASFNPPSRIGVFGPFPAGDYTIHVTPIATNVTPNVPCPLLTIPLVVRQLYSNEPVPVTNGWLAALMAGLVGLLGAFALRRLRTR